MFSFIVISGKVERIALWQPIHMLVAIVVVESTIGVEVGEHRFVRSCAIMLSRVIIRDEVTTGRRHLHSIVAFTMVEIVQQKFALFGGVDDYPFEVFPNQAHFESVASRFFRINQQRNNTASRI